MESMLLAECMNIAEVTQLDIELNVSVLSSPPPTSVWTHLFCGAGHEQRRGEQLKWSLACRLYIGTWKFRFPFAQLSGPVHTARLGRVCFI